jgi:hypothetical protein
MLVTERVRQRAWCEADKPRLAANHADAELIEGGDFARPDFSATDRSCTHVLYVAASVMAAGPFGLHALK